MKLYQRKSIPGQSLCRGFLGVYFFMAVSVLCMLTGCGKQDSLLSELGQEEVSECEIPDSEEVSEESFAEGEDGDTQEGPKQETAGTEADGESNGNTEAAGSILVHVCGAVVSPGVYELPAESRFYEAVEKAGGFAEDACRDYLNMAAPLADGSRLEIPALQDIQEMEKVQGAAPGAITDSDKEYNYYTVPEASAPQAESGGSSGGLVNINTADIPGLCSLPGIGEGRAKAIVEYREKQGGFQKKEDIMQVSGIGEKMYARMEEYLTVE